MKRNLYLASASLMAATLPMPALAQDTALSDLVRKQAQKIEELEARLAALEGSKGGSAGNTVTVTRSAASPQFQGDAGSDGGFTFHPRGRLWIDASTTSGSRHSERNLTGTELRSARLGAEGRIAGKFGYKVEAELADGDVSLKDSWLGWFTKASGNALELYAGNKLNDRGIEGASGDANIPFMDRNFVAQGLSPAKGLFGLGVMAKLVGPNWHASVNVAGDSASNAGTASDALSIIGRAHWTPVHKNGLIVHLGGWGFYENFPSSRTSAGRQLFAGHHFNDNVRHTAGSILNPDRSTAYGAEAAIIAGPVWSAAEAGRRRISAENGSFDHEALSLSAGIFLTGDKPSFSASTGTWKQPRISNPVTEGGSGAWELVSRYDRLDFSEAPGGSKGRTMTLGVNWHLTDWSRLMLHWANWTIEEGAGAFQGKDDGNTISIRAQAVF